MIVSRRDFIKEKIALRGSLYQGEIVSRRRLYKGEIVLEKL